LEKDLRTKGSNGNQRKCRSGRDQKGKFHAKKTAPLSPMYWSKDPGRLREEGTKVKKLIEPRVSCGSGERKNDQKKGENGEMV